MSLRKAIEAEGGRFVQFLNNRWKLVALTSVDIFNGKRQQMLEEPVATEIEIEEIYGDAAHGGETSGQEGHSQLARETVSSSCTGGSPTTAEVEGGHQEEEI